MMNRMVNKEFAQEIAAVIRTAQNGDRLPELLTLDFSGVTFMDSSGIGLILGRVRTAALWGGHVTVRGLSPQLKKMAELSGVSALAVLEDAGKGAKT